MSTRARRLVGALAPHFKLLAALVTILGIGIALASQRRAIAEFDWQLSWRAFLAAVLLFALAPLAQGVSFWLILRALALSSRFDEALVIWMRSFLLRYAPTGALAFVIRVRERERLGASSASVLTASGYEQLAALASGGIACVAGFAAAGSWPPVAGILICAAAVAVSVAVRPRFLGRLVQRLLAARGIEIPTLLRGRALALVIAVNALGWLATGAAAWALVHALSEEETPALAWLIGVYSFAWLLGFLVPLLPGGLGLRDGTLVVLLAGAFGTGVATAIALALRLANTFGELVAIGVTELTYRVWRRRRPRLPELALERRRNTAP